MWKEIGSVFKLIGTTGDGCRCVLLVGKGKAFCAGIDFLDPDFGLVPIPKNKAAPTTLQNITAKKKMKATDGMRNNSSTQNMIHNIDTARKFLSFKPKILAMQQAFTDIEECPVPVIAAIHGACIGGGVDLACCADIRMCSSSAVFSVREVRLGLAADVGTLQRFPKICAAGHGSRVRELCFTGGEFGSKEAQRIGFVSRVVGGMEKEKEEEDLFSTCLKLCNEIAKYSPVAVAGTKSSLNYSRDHSIKEGLEHIAMHNAAALMTDDLTRSFMAASSSNSNEEIFCNLLPHARL